MTQEQWTAIKTRDSSYDGIFYYGLKTTKHICRPSCPSRLCNPKNVIIFNTYDDGLAYGFKPCLKCHPELPSWKGSKEELAQSAKELIEEHYREKFSLKEIASALFVNESYLERVFKEITGQTLLAYHNRIRCDIAKELLTHNELSISYISDSVGYVSPSHFTQKFRKLYGSTPSQFRKEYLENLA